MEIIRPKFKRGFIASGVYKMIIDDKWFYIGSSDNIRQRIVIWKTNLKRGTFKNSNIRKILTQSSKIIFEIIKITDKGDSIKQEDIIIKDCFNDPHCLNMCPSAFDCSGLRFPMGESGRTIKRSVVLPKNKGVSPPPKKIARFDKKGNLIDIKPSIRSMAIFMGVPTLGNRISKVAKGHSKWFRGFIFKFVSDDGSFIDANFISRKNGRKFYQISSSGEILATHTCIASASRIIGCSEMAIYRLLYKISKFNKSNDFKFVFADEYDHSIEKQKSKVASQGTIPKEQGLEK